MTKFLLACDNAADDSMCPDGEPVVPNYPSGPQNTFLGAKSGKLCMTAEVRQCQDGLGLLLDGLSTQYPGLPRSLHKAYIVETAVAADSLAEGVKLRLVSSYDNADLVADDGSVTNLWKKQPL